MNNISDGTVGREKVSHAEMATIEIPMEVYDFETLDEFWEGISPIGSIFNEIPRGFLFRGQRDSEWALRPKVFRRDVVEKYKTGMMRNNSDHPGQTFFEWSLLNSFMYFCDRRGLAVPGDSMEFRELFSFNRIVIANGMDNSSWPPNFALPLMALAQHHGVPTRLLDWSSNPMVACYFAAASAVNEATEKGKKIAVYGFAFNQHRKAPYRYVHVPGSTSPNISAQAGCFLLVNNSGRMGEEFDYEVSLEKRLIGGETLKKLTLPVELAGELLHRCHLFGISAASIYPGYDGVAQAVLEWNLATSLTDRLK